ncbi:MAG: DUF5591 domain-containing protein [Promethearchaeota archaeon]
MELTRFEIRKQLGLARMGRFKFGTKTFTTPNLYLPQNPTILRSLFSTSDENGVYPSSFQKLTAFHPLVGYSIHDPLHITDLLTAPAQTPEDILEGKVEFANCFFESQEMFGYPIVNQESAEAVITTLDAIPVLGDKFPNSTQSRYREYNLHAFQLRLKFYEEMLFPADESQKYILEIKFSPEDALLRELIQWIDTHKTRIIGIKITNLFQNLMNFQTILRWIFTLKQELPSNLLWILGGQIYPQDYALAIYLGFDLIDLRTIFLKGLEGLFFTNQSRKWLRELRFPLCSCAACSQLTDHLTGTRQDSSRVNSLIVQHNFHTALQELFRINQHIYEGTFRTLLEAQIHSSPLAASMLRSIDTKYSTRINARFPLINSYRVQCIGPESYRRPEIVNFIDRVKSEVTPGRSYLVVVILPCSAKKPYSQSRSHGKFVKTIRKAAGKFEKFIHQVIITSPTGLIPRELEKTFPAAHYDIPVTGEWDQTEIKTTGECLAHWLQKYTNSNNSPPTIIAHVSGGYQQACRYAETLLQKKTPSSHQATSPFLYTIPADSPAKSTSAEALTALKNQISTVIQTHEAEFVTLGKNKLEMLTNDEVIIRATLDYQFGKGAGDIITSRGAILKKSRRPEYNEAYVFDGAGKILVGRYYNNSGLFRLTPRGAELFISHPRNVVKIRELELLGTTVFRPILDSLDPHAHPGDDVIVLDAAMNYLGIGELVQAPFDALHASSGKIVNIRKKVKHSSAKAKRTPENPSDLDNLEDLGL